MSEISIVIPAYNEGDMVGETMEEAEEAGTIVLESPRKGRAAQMNVGTEQTNGQILYFYM